MWFSGTAELSPWSWGTPQDCLLGCSWVSGQGIITWGEPSPASQAFPNTKPFLELALTNFSPGLGDGIHGLVGSSPSTQG